MVISRGQKSPLARKELKVNKRPSMIGYVYLYSWYTITTTILQSGLFLSDVWCILWLVQPLCPLDPRRPLHMLYMFIAPYHCRKGILGLGGGGGGVGKHLKTNWKTPISSLRKWALIYDIWLFSEIDPAMVRGYEGDITQAVPGATAYHRQLKCVLIKCRVCHYWIMPWKWVALYISS